MQEIGIASKGKGKSGGARVISFMAIMNEEDGFIELLTIYDKSEMESISDKELLNLMKRNGLFQSIITQNPAGITASRIHFQKPNLKVYLVISIYAISIIVEPDIHSHNLRAKKMGNVILYVTITI